MMGEKFFSPVKSFFLNVNGLIHICKSNVNERELYENIGFSSTIHTHN